MKNANIRYLTMKINGIWKIQATSSWLDHSINFENQPSWECGNEAAEEKQKQKDASVG